MSENKAGLNKNAPIYVPKTPLIVPLFTKNLNPNASEYIPKSLKVEDKDKERKEKDERGKKENEEKERKEREEKELKEKEAKEREEKELKEKEEKELREKEEKERKEKEEKERKEKEEKERIEKEELERKAKEEQERKEREQIEKERQEKEKTKEKKTYTKEQLMALEKRAGISSVIEDTIKSDLKEILKGAKKGGYKNQNHKSGKINQRSYSSTNDSRKENPILNKQLTEEEITMRQLISNLNKLSLEKFEEVAAEIDQIQIKNEQLLVKFVEALFLKVIDEAHYSPMYAKLCEKMSTKTFEFADSKSRVFRKILLNMCQTEFEKKFPADKTPEEKQSMTPEMLEEHELERTKLKRRSLGNMTFIGELYKLNILNEGIMHECIARLLTTAEEKDLECMCNLMQTIGKILDKPEAHDRMAKYFKRIETLANNKKTSQRIKFLLMDVMDLRTNQWIPRREKLKAMKLEDLRLEIELEEKKKSSSSSRSSSRTSSSGRFPTMSEQNLGGRKRSDHGGIHRTSSQQAVLPNSSFKEKAKEDKSAIAFKSRVENLLEELFNSKNVAESVTSAKYDFQEVEESNLSTFVQNALNYTLLSKKTPEAILLGRFVGALLDEEVIFILHLTNGLNQFISLQLDGVTEDSPIAAGNLGSFLFQVIGSRLPLDIISKIKWEASSSSSKSVISLFKELGTLSNIRERVRKSSFSFKTFIEKYVPRKFQGEALDSWIADNGLEFLNEPKSETKLVEDGGFFDQVKQENRAENLVTMISGSNDVSDHFYFNLFYALFAKGEAIAILKNKALATVLEDKVEKNGKAVEVLRALQVFTSASEDISKKASELIHCLYDAEITKEEYIWEWTKENKEEYPGKADLLLSIHDFLYWLKTAEEGEEDEE